MKRLMVLILFVCSIFLTGCTTYWYQEDKSFNECKQDRDECVTELQKYYDLDHIDNPERDFMENCMIDIMYEIPSIENVKECVISEEVVLNKEAPILLYEQKKKQA